VQAGVPFCFRRCSPRTSSTHAPLAHERSACSRRWPCRHQSSACARVAYKRCGPRKREQAGRQPHTCSLACHTCCTQGWGAHAAVATHPGRQSTHKHLDTAVGWLWWRRPERSSKPVVQPHEDKHTHTHTRARARALSVPPQPCVRRPLPLTW